MGDLCGDHEGFGLRKKRYTGVHRGGNGFMRFYEVLWFGRDATLFVEGLTCLRLFFLGGYLVDGGRLLLMSHGIFQIDCAVHPPAARSAMLHVPR